MSPERCGCKPRGPSQMVHRPGCREANGRSPACHRSTGSTSSCVNVDERLFQRQTAHPRLALSFADLTPRRAGAGVEIVHPPSSGASRSSAWFHAGPRSTPQSTAISASCSPRSSATKSRSESAEHPATSCDDENPNLQIPQLSIRSKKSSDRHSASESRLRNNRNR